uniref:Uncharacterized protein n=1 Tax=Lotharella oceanica TaxID=641309 RepID=A0A7S2U1W6_9EUKA|mmetsp:Transcript_4308/g.8659  ORF Transcript_4308/g.8659 Transcript_4308/m.8659 type:complete len:236 (+) Transcript_4308:1-708(+)
MPRTPGNTHYDLLGTASSVSGHPTFELAPSAISSTQSRPQRSYCRHTVISGVCFTLKHTHLYVFYPPTSTKHQRVSELSRPIPATLGSQVIPGTSRHLYPPRRKKEIIIMGCAIPKTKEEEKETVGFEPGFYTQDPTFVEKFKGGIMNNGAEPYWHFGEEGRFVFADGRKRKEGEWKLEDGLIKMKGKTFAMGSRQPWMEKGEFECEISPSDFVKQNGNKAPKGWKPPRYVSALD